MGSKLTEGDSKSPSPKNTICHNSKKFNCKDILTSTDLLNTAIKLVEGEIEPTLVYKQFGTVLHGKKQKTWINPLYGVILTYIYLGFWRYYYELYEYFSHIKPRTLRKYLKNLQELKWLRRHGRGYHLNPFLYKMIKKDKRFMLLLEYAPLKIDFFDILNLPLINASKRKVKVTRVEVDYFEVKYDKYFREIFRGVVCIDLHFKDEQKADTILPVNLHGQPIYGKKEYLEHCCIPLKWRLFDIQKASYYGTNHKRSHHKGAKNKSNEFIHFDNSISLLFQPKGRFYYPWQKEFFERRKTSIKYWQNYEYLEVNDIAVLKRLFVKRFVNGKRRLNLFKALGMEHKQISGRPKKIRKRQRIKLIKPVNGREAYQKELAEMTAKKHK